MSAPLLYELAPEAREAWTSWLKTALNAAGGQQKSIALDLEKQEKELQTEVMKGGMPAEQLQKGYERLGTLAQQIAKVMEEWENASTELQALAEEV